MTNNEANLLRANIVHAQTTMKQMQNELSGCDWCCGGGDEQWDYLSKSIERYKKQLLSNNEHLPDERPIDCDRCHHFPATHTGQHNEPVCVRCFTTFDNEVTA